MNQIYYKEIGGIPTLTQEEQLVLITKANAGDSKALNQLAECNLKLVIHHAKKYEKYLPINSAITIDDLISEGNIGLIKAIQKFDPSHGTHLSYFAGVSIKRGIIDCLIANANLIKLPYRKFKKLQDISNTINKMLQSEGEININVLESLYTPAEIQLFNLKPRSITTDNDFELANEDDNNEQEMIEKLELALKQLKPRESKIITEYYGIVNNKKSITQIAKDLNISKQRVSQIQHEIFKKLRSILDTLIEEINQI